jgi:hypothetical protein
MKLRWLIPPLVIIAVVAIIGPDKLVSRFREQVDGVQWALRVSEGSAPPANAGGAPNAGGSLQSTTAPGQAPPANAGGSPNAGGAPLKRGTERLYDQPLNVTPPHISTDRTVRYDYDIVYVRALRRGDQGNSLWPEIAHPALMDSGSDLMLLHPDGSEELLVQGGPDGSVTDPFVSFDGEWVYYSHVKGLRGTSVFEQPPIGGADIYRIHLKSRQIVRLTHQEYTPNTGAADWSSDVRRNEPGKTHLTYGVLNLGPCPLPGGRIVFTSNRNAFIPPKHSSPCLQLFVMDDDGKNVECIGHLNVSMALHPIVLTDGRIMFSSMESQGLRTWIHWSLWSIHPDGTNWAPLLSAFDPTAAPNAFHFQTQLSDSSIVAEQYYNQNNSGFGAYWKLPLRPASEYPQFGPAYMRSPLHQPLRFGRHYNGKPYNYVLPFMPRDAVSLTPFANNGEGAANPSVLKDKDSPAVGKFTHPAAAPDNHLLTIWSPGPVNHQFEYRPMPDGGIYLLKNGQPIEEPGQMLLIKNDPRYNEQYPRPVVSYKRMYGIDEPLRIAPLANDGTLSPHLPPGTPFGLIGTSSLYKRESYPNGVVPPGGVTAGWVGGPDRNGYQGLDPFNTSENEASLNWFNQGGDAGRYRNEDIHAIRILATEPTTHRQRGPREGRLFKSHATERLRILGEIPVRKFNPGQPLDADGNPDTSFLAKIPADTAFTFQTLDKDGMVLNMSQTWHQLRPGEIRNNCGGCHAHSQQPTLFEKTAAAGRDYQVFDLVARTPLLTTRDRDESGHKWDERNEAGLRFEPGVKNVEYYRDIKPILDRSCVACHTHNNFDPPGNLVLDDPRETEGVPVTYYRLAMDREARYGHRPVIHNKSWRQSNASRYIRMFQSRRSLLVWKILGRRTDGWTNDDFPTERVPGDADTLMLKGKSIPNTKENRDRADLDFLGTAMPPPSSITGDYEGPDGKRIKVPPLTAEDRLTIIRWIDLGCPIDLDFDPMHPGVRGFGWMCDDNRPIVAVTLPPPGQRDVLDCILIGLHDYYSGLDMGTFEVKTDFAIDGVTAGQNLAPRFVAKSPGVWELRLATPIRQLKRGTLVVSVKDRQGNVTRVERVIGVGR